MALMGLTRESEVNESESFALRAVGKSGAVASGRRVDYNFSTNGTRVC